MGNAMVFKAVGKHAALGAGWRRSITEAGLPDGLFNVVQGYGDVGLR